MKISFIKYGKQEDYKIPTMLGMKVEEIKKPEEIDSKIQELKDNKYTTIILSDELASFSEKINEYKTDETLKIIITPSK